MAHDHILEEQVAYYRAIAPEYEDHSIDADGQAELRAAFSSFDISGDVLELACGPGGWTQQLVHRATSITAVDASPEMIARAQLLVSDAPVRFVESDLFSWEPDRRYDAVFFGFWLSHVPEDRVRTVLGEDRRLPFARRASLLCRRQSSHHTRTR